MSDYAARAATAAELIQLRNTSEVVFTARVNQSTPLTNTNELTYDGETGTYTDIKLGMIVWVGSAAGLHDRGETTVRLSASATVLYTNQIKFTFADNDYITVKSKGGQATKLGLAIQHPATVYTARINQTFTTLDGIAQLTYDGGTGSIYDILPGMTVFIGTSAGAQDKGICRVRKAPTATVLYINQVSDVVFDEDDYITVINAFSLWQRDTTVTGDVVSMDYDIPFGGALNGGCLPRIGPMVAVINQTSGTITFTPPSPALTTCYDGATIVSYLYDAPGAATTSNMTAGDGTASWTYPLTANQEYRWSCSITDSLNRVTISYRWVFINPTTIPFKFEECVGDYSENGWSFTVTVYDDATKAEIYDRAMCTLYATDYYSGSKVSIGKIAGYENIVCSGWIDGESITMDSESGAVTFIVRGAAGWLSKTRAFPFEVQNTTTTAANWKQIEDMTIDKALFQLLFWTTTAPLVMDCFLTGDTNIIKVVAQPSGNVLDQIVGITESLIFATPLVNSYNQLYVEIDSQMLSTLDRGSITEVMEITKADRAEEIDIEHNTTSKTSMIEFGALETYDGVTDVKLYSRAPGNSGKTYGSIDAHDNYVVADQNDANRISGCLLAISNNPYETVDISLAQNNRLFDIAPLMYGKLSILAADNPRGIVITDADIIPRKVEYIYNEDAGSLETNISFEFATTGIVDGVTYVPPTVTEEGQGDYKIDTGNLDFPSSDLGDLFPDVPNPPDVSPCSAVPNSFTVGWSPRELVGDGGPLQAKAYFPCKLRATPMPTSKVKLNMTLGGDAAANYTVTAFKAGSTVASASPVSGDPASWEFILGSEVDVDGFQIDLASGAGSSVDFTIGDVIETGTVAATDNTYLLAATTVVDQYYSINGTGGGWKKAAGWTDEYDFIVGCGTQVSGNSGIGLSTLGDSVTSEFHLDFGSIGLDGWALDSKYGIVIFKANGTQVGYVVADTAKGDNLGSLGYVFRNVTANGRRMELNTAIIQNVCSVG